MNGEGEQEMCRKAEICPYYTCNSLANDRCKHCAYLKKEKKQILALRIISAVTFVVFLISTHFHLVR